MQSIIKESIFELKTDYTRDKIIGVFAREGGSEDTDGIYFFEIDKTKRIDNPHLDFTNQSMMIIKKSQVYPGETIKRILIDIYDRSHLRESALIVICFVTSSIQNPSSDLLYMGRLNANITWLHCSDSPLRFNERIMEIISRFTDDGQPLKIINTPTSITVAGH